MGPQARATGVVRPQHLRVSAASMALERAPEAPFVAEEILAVEIGCFQPEHVLDGVHDRLGVGIELVLQLAYRRAGRVGKADALDRRLELAEAFFVDAAESSALKPLSTQSQSAMMQRPVRLTDLTISPSSSGARVRGSTISTETPRFCRMSAARRASTFIHDRPTMVTSRPGRRMRPTPSGIS